MIRSALLLSLAVWLFPSVAYARLHLITADGGPSRRDAQLVTALAASPDGVVELVDNADAITALCGARSCTMPDAPFIWLREDATRADLLHEVGHRFAYAMSAHMRHRFLALTNQRGHEWDSAAPNPPNEQFAEAWRMCAQDPKNPDRSQWGYTYHPAGRTHRRVCRTIRREAERQGWTH